AATTESYALSLHDALPISRPLGAGHGHRPRTAVTDVRLQAARPAPDLGRPVPGQPARPARHADGGHGRGGPAAPSRGHARRLARDRKSTRLNSSHVKISYA